MIFRFELIFYGFAYNIDIMRGNIPLSSFLFTIRLIDTIHHPIVPQKRIISKRIREVTYYGKNQKPRGINGYGIFGK